MVEPGTQKKYMTLYDWFEPVYEDLEEGEMRGIEIKLEPPEWLKRSFKEYIRNDNEEKFNLPVFRLWDKPKTPQPIVENNTESEDYLVSKRPNIEAHVYRLNYNPTIEDVIHFKNNIPKHPTSIQDYPSEIRRASGCEHDLNTHQQTHESKETQTEVDTRRYSEFLVYKYPY